MYKCIYKLEQVIKHMDLLYFVCLLVMYWGLVVSFDMQLILLYLLSAIIQCTAIVVDIESIKCLIQL